MATANKTGVVFPGIRLWISVTQSFYFFEKWTTINFLFCEIWDGVREKCQGVLNAYAHVDENVNQDKGTSSYC